MQTSARLFVFLSLILFCMGDALAQAGPRDVRLLNAAERVLLTEATKEQAVDALAPILMDSCSQIAKESGSPGVFQLNSEEFESGLRRLIGKLAKPYLTASTGKKRRVARRQLLRQVTDRATAMSLVETWLGLRGVRTGGAGKIDFQGFLPISDQVSASSTANGLSLAADKTKLVGDSGGPGGGNGAIDGGEWIDLELVLTNNTGRPWFSTSATTKSNHPCVFVPKNYERVLKEMSPGESTKVPASFYVSRNCTSNSTSFQIEIRDTWRTPGAPQRLLISVSPTPTGNYRVLAKQIDSDDPGSSDGSGTRALGPDNAYELSLGLRTSARFGQAAMGIGFASQDQPLFEGITIRPTLLQKTGPGRFAPGDDIDIKLVGPATYLSVFRSRAEDSRWVSLDTSEKSYVWLAVDTVLGWEARPGQSASTVIQPGPIGKIPLAQILRWIGRHTELSPRPVSTKAANAIEATDGYEIVFDKTAFAKAYKEWGQQSPQATSAVDPIVLGYTYRSYVPVRLFVPEEVQGCTDSQASNFDMKATKDDGSCTYVRGCTDSIAQNYNPQANRSDNSCRYRRGCMDESALNYDRSAVRADNSCRYARGCMDRSALNYDRAAVRDDGNCEFPPPYVRFDGGMRFLSFTGRTLTSADPDEVVQQFWDYEKPMSINGKLRASFGNRWRGMASVEGGTFPSTMFASSLLSGGRFAIEAGGGRAFRWMDGNLELELLAKLGFSKVSFSGQVQLGDPTTEITNTSQDFYLHYGLEPRLIFRFMPNLGLFAGFSWESGMSVTILTPTGRQGVVLSIPRTGLELGVSYFY
jgi:hypothetical protein